MNLRDFNFGAVMKWLRYSCVKSDRINLKFLEVIMFSCSKSYWNKWNKSSMSAICFLFFHYARGSKSYLYIYILKKNSERRRQWQSMPLWLTTNNKFFFVNQSFQIEINIFSCVSLSSCACTCACAHGRSHVKMRRLLRAIVPLR